MTEPVAPASGPADRRDPPARAGVTRRHVLIGTAGVLVAGAAGAVGYALAADDEPGAQPSPTGTSTAGPTGTGATNPNPAHPSPANPSPASTAPADTARATPAAAVPSAGVHQAGVALPAVPQSACLVVIADLNRAALATSLAALGDAIGRVTDPAAPLVELTPDGPGDLTVTVGLGAGALAATDRPTLADLVALPEFRGDAALPAAQRGGDLLLSVNASDPTILEPVLAHLAGTIDGYRPRWSDFGYRGPADQGVTRNPFGYFDGIIVPRSADDLAADVWIADGPLAGGTICVIRRFRLDTNGFRTLSAPEQDRTIGRHRSDGAPLSGGDRFAEIDLNAKADNGDLLVPLHAHARAAHPSFTGSRLMLRRSYSYQHSATDHGHLFISHQNDVQAFAKTQLRLDEVDDLMHFATPTATAAFAILPGTVDAAGASRPLGATLFG